MMKPFLIRLYTVAIALCCATTLVTSCSDDEEAVPVTGVLLDNSTLLLVEGQKQALKAIITPENATNKSVTWSTSSTSVATVNNMGEVEAKTAGTTIITVTTVDGSKTATCEVTVQKTLVSVASVALDKTELPLLVGNKETLTATIAPVDATIKTVVWATSDAAVATVSEMGEVEAKAVGTAIITVTTLDGEKIATCVVTVDTREFTATFNTNGGTSIESVVIEKGTKLTKPTDPTKEGGLDEGLYLGKVDPKMGSYTFGGWYTDEALTTAYDFNTEVMKDFTLYAKWNVDSGNLPKPINLESVAGDDIMVKAYTYLNGLSLNGPAEYTFLLASNITANGTLPAFKNENVTLNFIGKGEERVIKRTISGIVFTIEGGTFVLRNNIKFTAENIGNFYIFNLLGKGHLVMEDGAKISDIKGATGRAAAVYVTSGDADFTMNGGEICNNRIEGSSGVHTGVAVSLNWGKFYMKGGLISGNTLKTSYNTHCVAGGVLAIIRTPFIKTGGVIKDNTAEITTPGNVGRAGHQVFCFATGADGPANHRKVDDNLGATDNLGNDDMTNPLWRPAP